MVCIEVEIIDLKSALIYFFYFLMLFSLYDLPILSPNMYIWMSENFLIR